MIIGNPLSIPREGQIRDGGFPQQEGEEPKSKAASKSYGCCSCWKGLASLISRKLKKIAGRQTEFGETNPWSDLQSAYSTNAANASLKQRIRVLLAETNPTNCMAWNQALSGQYNCEIVEVNSGQEAMNEMLSSQANPFDVIILEENMPKLRGSEVAFRIRDLVSTNVLIFSCCSRGENIGFRIRKVDCFDAYLRKGSTRDLFTYLQLPVIERYPKLAI